MDRQAREPVATHHADEPAYGSKAERRVVIDLTIHLDIEGLGRGHQRLCAAVIERASSLGARRPHSVGGRKRAPDGSAEPPGRESATP